MQSKKPALFFALQAEAQPFINITKAKQQIAFATIKLYTASDCFIVITGIGQVNMSVAVGWFFAKHNNEISVVFNIGTAASVHCELHTWHQIVAIHNSQTKQSFFPEMLSANVVYKYATLNTVIEPCNSETLQLIQEQLVDMEGFAFAKAAQKFMHTNAIHLIKWVSDNGNLNFYKNKIWQQEYANDVTQIVQFLFSIHQQLLTIESAYIKSSEIFVNRIKQDLQLSFTETHQLIQALQYALAKNETAVAPICKTTHTKIAFEKEIQLKKIINQLYHV
jgi:nucleoside phosphorylase